MRHQLTSLTVKEYCLMNKQNIVDQPGAAQELVRKSGPRYLVALSWRKEVTRTNGLSTRLWGGIDRKTPAAFFEVFPAGVNGSGSGAYVDTVEESSFR